MTVFQTTVEMTRHLRLVAVCPVNKGVPVKMTREAFRRACIAVRTSNTGSVGGRRGPNSPCNGCRIKAAVESGGRLSAPAGVSFMSIKEHGRLVSEYSRGRSVFVRPYRVEVEPVEIVVPEPLEAVGY